MSRPYFKKTTRDLVSIFEECGHDATILDLLLEELGRRHRPQAVELRDKVKRALSSVNESTNEPIVSKQLPLHFTNDETAAPVQTAKAPSQATPVARDINDNYANITFKKIEPVGVQGRPQKFSPKLDASIDFGLQPEAPLPEQYGKALNYLIAEMKKSGSGYQQIMLDNGQRANTEGEGIAYVFAFSGEANLFDGAQVTIILGGQHCNGQIASVSAGKLVVVLDQDLGPVIKSCVLKYDATALLVALEKRLGELASSDALPFNMELAKQVMSNSGVQIEPDGDVTIVDTEALNAKQRRFVALALVNSVSYLWGPPGTGKTQTLSALIRTLYEQGKRILICSNTNQAVDQVLLKLCRALESANDPALEDGAILRVGRITHPELEEQFHDFVTIDGLVERKSEELLEAKQSAEEGLHRIGLKLEPIDRHLKDFEHLYGLKVGLKGHQGQLSKTLDVIKTAKTGLAHCGIKLTQLREEKNVFASAGKVRRLFLRNPKTVQNEIDQFERKRTSTSHQVEQLTSSISTLLDKVKQLESDIGKQRIKVTNLDLDDLKIKRAALDAEMVPLRDEISRIDKALEDIRKEVMDASKIVGSTITKAYLSAKDFASFDVVIVDEASMVLPPALFHAAGLAKERCIISGDFRQLSPIVQTKAQSIKDILGRNVFETAGIADAVGENRIPPRVILLDEQYRMDDGICDLISTSFYNSNLTTAQDRISAHSPMISHLLQDRLIIVDTSRVFPFSARNAFKSRYNLMHALAVRNLCRHFWEQGFVDGKGSVGVCTPYNAQANLLSKVLIGAGLGDKVDAGTVHRYQGDEKTLMIIDFPDGFGERMAGIFLQADSLSDDGAKLLNVAISRAQEQLVIFANLTVLDDKLPGNAFLRGILHRIQSRGQVIDVRDVLGLYPIETDLSTLVHAQSFELPTEVLEKNLFDQKSFDSVIAADISTARESVVIYSGFITPNRVGALAELLRMKITEGVKVRCVTRPPNNNGSIPEAQGREALMALQGIGAIIDLRLNMHQKVVMIDDEVLWHGSLNPLSHAGGTGEIMTRFRDQGVTVTYASFLALQNWPGSEDNTGKAVLKENPDCPDCGGWSVYADGRYGPYIYCESGCGWKQNLGRDAHKQSTQNSRATIEDAGNAPMCPKCHVSMKQRTGRFGHFWGCPNYPSCTETIKIH